MVVVLGGVDDGGARRGAERKAIRERAGHAGLAALVEERDAGQRGGQFIAFGDGLEDLLPVFGDGGVVEFDAGDRRLLDAVRAARC